MTTTTEYKARCARDAQEMKYGDKSYWDMLEEKSHEHYAYYMRKGDKETAEKMLTQTIGECLIGNDGD
jgi:hypothetical protein